MHTPSKYHCIAEDALPLQVALQRKMFAEFERRDKARKVSSAATYMHLLPEMWLLQIAANEAELLLDGSPPVPFLQAGLCMHLIGSSVHC